VGKPGPVYIPAQKDMTLVEAITEAGGPTEKAAATVNITRILPDGSTTTLKDVDLYGAMHDAKKDVQLQEGDNIFLGESAFANVYQH
jgi:protein involved in polysaccharide export with SLBB domain